MIAPSGKLGLKKLGQRRTECSTILFLDRNKPYLELRSKPQLKLKLSLLQRRKLQSPLFPRRKRSRPRSSNSSRPGSRKQPNSSRRRKRNGSEA